MSTKKLYRSRRNKMVAGIAGGLGKYLDVDPIIFRVLFIFLTFAGGSGAIIYFILLIIIPVESIPFEVPSGKTNDLNEETVINDDSATFTQVNDFVENTVNNMKWQEKGSLLGLTIGIILIVFGFYILSAKILHIDWMRFIFPILLISTGLIILISSMNSKNKNNA